MQPSANAETNFESVAPALKSAKDQVFSIYYGEIAERHALGKRDHQIIAAQINERLGFDFDVEISSFPIRVSKKESLTNFDINKTKWDFPHQKKSVLWIPLQFNTLLVGHMTIAIDWSENNSTKKSQFHSKYEFRREHHDKG